MDEMTLVRDYVDDAPLPDAARLADVRAKLVAEIQPRRKRKLVGVTSVGVAAAAAVALVVGLSGTPRGPDPVPPVQAPEVVTAAAVLDYAAEAALADPAQAPRPDQYLYLKVETANGYFERWTAVDGKRPGYVSYHVPNPPGSTGPTPACGTANRDGVCLFASEYVAADPKSVEETMRFVVHRESPKDPDVENAYVKAAARLVANNMLSPSLTAAVFRALKVTGPPVVRQHDHDGTGREGIGIVWPGGLELIFDAKTYQLLGTPNAATTALKVVDHVGQR